MSDYIRKSRLKEISEIQKGDFNSVEGIRSWIDRQPTLDEKEIIRKAFERVVERLEHEEQEYNELRKFHKKNGNKTMEGLYVGKTRAYQEAIEIVKEEGGIE